MTEETTIRFIKNVLLNSTEPRGKEAYKNLQYGLNSFLETNSRICELNEWDGVNEVNLCRCGSADGICIKENTPLKIPKDLLQRAIEKWGIEVQKDKIQEECQELALIMHQSKCPTKDAIESENQTYKELADLQFVAQYIPLIYDQSRLNKINKQRIIDFKNKYEL